MIWNNVASYTLPHSTQLTAHTLPHYTTHSTHIASLHNSCRTHSHIRNNKYKFKNATNPTVINTLACTHKINMLSQALFIGKHIHADHFRHINTCTTLMYLLMMIHMSWVYLELKKVLKMNNIQIALITNTHICKQFYTW